MRNSCRFAVAVHILTLLSCKEGRRVTSDILAASVNTHPVVIRRVLLALQRGGVVETQKGAGAGTKLARCPEKITLAEVYRAVEDENPFLLPLREPSRDCPVGQGIKSVLKNVFASVERAMEAELHRTTLSDVRQAIEEFARKSPCADVVMPVPPKRASSRRIIQIIK